MALAQAHERNNHYFGEFQHIAIELQPDKKTYRAYINGKLLMRGKQPCDTEEEAYEQALHYLRKDIKHAYEIELAVQKHAYL